MTVSMTGPDLDRPLRLALPQLRNATGIDGTMAGPVTLGGRRLVITGLHGMLTPLFRGQVVTRGAGVGGRALQQARPVAVNDYLHSTAISHHFDRKVQQEQARGAFAVPVRVSTDIRAMLYGVTRTAEPLGDRVLDAAASVAAGVGRELAIEIGVAARLRTIEQERQRLEHRLAADEPREIYEELMSIAQATSDQPLRDRLEILCDRLSLSIEPTVDGALHLTRRERQVLAAIALGHTNNEVAEQLSIMPTTVKTYLKNAMRKFGTRNRVETIHAARRAGFLT